MPLASRRHDDITKARAISLSRRQFLRGAGACVALPLLASDGAAGLLAADATTGAKLTTPPRLERSAPSPVFILTYNNRAIPGAWWPKGEGEDFAFSRTLQPLEKSKRHIQIMAGSIADTEAGARRRRPCRDAGIRSGWRSANRKLTAIRAGVSIDQAMAKEINHRTLRRLRPDVTSVHNTGNCDSGYSCAYRYNISGVRRRPL